MQTTIRQFIIGMLIFSALIAGCFSLIGMSLSSDSDTFLLANTTLSKFDDMSDNANSMQDTMQGQVDKSDDILGGLIELTISGLSSVWDSLTTLTGIMGSMGAAIGFPIPTWFSGLILAIVGVIIAFSLAAAYFKWWL